MVNNITIVIPAYMPDASLVQLVQSLADSQSKILVVNDGSGSEFEPVFKQLQAVENTIVLTHSHNQGKGQALKTAFDYLLKQDPETIGVVTADADGQHLLQDILNVRDRLSAQPDHLILGARQFQTKVPLRSRFGNVLTRYIFAGLIGKMIPDTQTGLRGIPAHLMRDCLAIRSTGYEFELEMLILAVNEHIPIEQCPITTVYENNNASSHFNPLVDSLKIYMVFIKFAAIGMIAALIDFFVFVACYFFTHNLLLSETFARGSGGLFSFFSNKHWVFKSKHDYQIELLKFFGLWLMLLCISYSLLYLTINKLHLNAYLCKITIQLLLFFVSFTLQRLVIFRHNSKRFLKKDAKCNS